ncbi:hypothetical protein PG984_000061 [Apiospora sp. TS-2023a]
MSADLSGPPYNVTPAENVSNLYASLMGSFGWVLLKLDRDSELPDSPILETAYEKCTRLRIWGLQNRISDPTETPGSLGQLLKEQPEVEKLVFEVLHDANTSLSYILEELEAGGVIPLEETSETESDSDTSNSSDSSSTPGLITYLKRTFENIGELYRLQSLLRKPRLKGKYLHSGQTHPDLPGYQQDYQHVRQKLDDWRRNLDPPPDEEERPDNEVLPVPISETDEAPGISPDILLQRQQSEKLSEEVTDILCRRLAAANRGRRKQLKYWQSHPYQQPQDKPVEAIGQSRRAKIVAAKGLVGTPKQATTNSDAPTSSKVPTTVHSFSTAPRSAIMLDEDDQIGEAIARTTYKPSIIGTVTRTTIRVPDIPQIAENSETASCPYCLAPLNSEILSSRENWKRRHVFRDLRPYVCTAQSCTDPDKKFATRYDWIYHETQLHHRQWPCSECQDVFESRDAFQTHCFQSHKAGWTKRQIEIFSDMRERSKDDAAPSVCQLCSLSMQHSLLLEHVADHLEELSLFALPRIATQNDDDNLAVSNEARESRTVDDMAKAEATKSYISVCLVISTPLLFTRLADLEQMENAMDIESILEGLSNHGSGGPSSISSDNPPLQPDSFEYPESSRSVTPLSQDREIPDNELNGIVNVSCGGGSDTTDSEFADDGLFQQLRLMRQARRQRQQRRMTVGTFNKRTVTERGSDSDREDLLPYDIGESTTRRKLRRKVGRLNQNPDWEDIIILLVSDNDPSEGDGDGDKVSKFWTFVEVEEAE